jgi:hypothetical protein
MFSGIDVIFYFYQILTAFNMLELLFEKVELILNFRDSGLECLNWATCDCSLWKFESEMERGKKDFISSVCWIIQL